MSVDQVLKAVPGSHETPPESRAPGKRLKDGSEQWIEGAPQTIAGHTFLPEYFFRDGALSLVRLELQGSQTGADTKAAYDDLLKYLRMQFGTEATAKGGTLAGGTITSHQLTFQTQERSVHVSMYVVGEETRTLVVAFRPATADAGHAPTPGP